MAAVGEKRLPVATGAKTDGAAPKGSPERDFIYVEDAVAAYLAVGEALERDDVRGQAFNAGAGEAIPVLEIVERMIEVSGRQIEPDVQGSGNPDGEIDRQFLDSAKIREMLG